MNAQNPTAATETPAPKRSLRNPLRKETDPNAPKASKVEAVKAKTKIALQVVGVVAIAGVAASAIAKKRGVKVVAATLPEVEVVTAEDV